MPYDQDQFVALYTQGIDSFTRYFWADDIDHAFEQAKDAEADGEIFVGVMAVNKGRIICNNSLAEKMLEAGEEAFNAKPDDWDGDV